MAHCAHKEAGRQVTEETPAQGIPQAGLWSPPQEGRLVQGLACEEGPVLTSLVPMFTSSTLKTREEYWGERSPTPGTASVGSSRTGGCGSGT